MPSKGRISAAEFVKDLRHGVTSSELMTKYSLVPRELDGILVQLKRAMVNPSDIYGRTSPNQAGEAVERIRSLHRNKVPLPVPIYEVTDPQIRGVIRDISEKGVGVQGLETKVDEVKTLVVLANEFFSINPFKLEAKCRWINPTGGAGGNLAGFEITNISGRSLEGLKKFIETYGRGDRASETAPKPQSSTLPSSHKYNGKTVWTCPFCEMPQPGEFEECPQCGIIVRKYLQRLDTTKSEILAIVDKKPRVELTTVSEKELADKKAIYISAKLWKDLKSLGGNPDDHVIRALSTYVLRNKANRSGM
jgi:hypothetical protein